MKKRLISLLIASLFVVSSLAVVYTVAAKEEQMAFSTYTTDVFTGSVSKFQTIWYTIENVDTGLMTVDIDWNDDVSLFAYISTSESRTTAIASGAGSCSDTITTPGTYYVGVFHATSRRAVTTAYTATVTYYAGGGSSDVTAPFVDITAPNDEVTLSDSVTITATASDSESGVDYVDCNFGGTNLASDYSSPYSWIFDTNTLGDGFHTITVTAYDVAGNFASDSITVEVFNDNPVQPGEKIFVAFWASDAGTQANIDEYWAVLQLEGYTKKFDFKDTVNFAADFATVDAYEDPEDTVFFYLFGHGNNNGEDSLTAFAPGTSVVYSSEMRVFFDTLDAERIGCLVESCHSGGFPVDFQAEPYLMMSTSDEDHNSYALSTLPGEGLFSDAFFDHVLDGYCAVDSFYFAEQVVFDTARNPSRMQYPMIADYSDYVWFV
ncbi:MAG: hypothetical protein EU530_06370 [Promethearchaeota archaeon]|nr:MAG: hypothetical protein EU530_06370 [Candidatus Lokiarchaeota archaeon]